VFRETPSFVTHEMRAFAKHPNPRKVVSNQMSTHIVVIDAYHQALIDEGAATVLSVTVPHVASAEPEPEEESGEAETKVVRGRGRPRKEPTEGVETK
jgi:hypothetical protein